MNALQVSLMWFGFFAIITMVVFGGVMLVTWIADIITTFTHRVKNVFIAVEGGTLLTRGEARLDASRLHALLTSEYSNKMLEMQRVHDSQMQSLNAYVNFLDKEQTKRVDAIVKQTNENIISSATIAANIAHKHNELVEYVDEEVAGLYEEIDRVCKVNEEECEYCVTCCEDDKEATVATENVEGHKS